MAAYYGGAHYASYRSLKILFLFFRFSFLLIRMQFPHWWNRSVRMSAPELAKTDNVYAKWQGNK